MSTTLPLYWSLSAPAKKERMDSSVKLIQALHVFQAEHNPPGMEDDSDEETVLSIDSLNAQDVSYALKRLIRGLASPRESSRLGFSVVLTELLSRLNTVTTLQIIALIESASEMTGSMTGQDERDMMFARLFGISAIIHSGLLIREAVIPNTTHKASTLEAYQKLLSHLIILGHKKAWFTESCWWSVVQAISAISSSSCNFKSDALDWTFNEIFIQQSEWSPEKIAVWLQFRNIWQSKAKLALRPLFKGDNLLATSNLAQLAKILKDVDIEDEDGLKQSSSGSWQPRPHFVWEMLFQAFLEHNEDELGISSFQDFFRVAVDESLFASNSSPERKYTGFQLVEQAMRKAPPSVIPQLFTKNFVRTWVNQLSVQDRYLHKAALKLAGSVSEIVKSKPSSGFPLMVALLGPNGTRDFDKITKTKTVETILGSMGVADIQKYVDHLFEIYKEGSHPGEVSEADQKWVVEQCASLVRSSLVPKGDEWVTSVLNLFIREGFFTTKSKVLSVTTFDSVQSLCRDRLHSSLADLSIQNPQEHADNKSTKYQGRNSSQEYWVTIVVSHFRKLLKDEEKYTPLFDIDELAVETRSSAWTVIKSLNKISGDRREAAEGASLYVNINILNTFSPEAQNENLNSIQRLKDSLSTVQRLFDIPAKSKKQANGITKLKDSEQDVKPIDLLVDDLIGYLEKSTALMRVVVTQIFSGVCSEAETSTVDLILTQLEPRSVQPDIELDEEEIDDEDEGEDDDSQSPSEDSNSDDDSTMNDEDEESGEEVDPELRKKIAAALGTRDSDDDEGSQSSASDASGLMDDDQMMELDEKLADIFRSHSGAAKNKSDGNLQREATHFKIRVLDLLDILIRRLPESPHIPRLLLPLLRTVITASPDEKQLKERATGILRGRIGTQKTFPHKNVDIEAISKDFQDVHEMSRKVSPSQISPATLNPCCIYLSKVLANSGSISIVKEQYKESLNDFMSRKGSKVHPTFFLDFIHRYDAVAWELRHEFIYWCNTGKPTNQFRQMQAFHFLEALLSHMTELDKSKSIELSETLPSIRDAIYGMLRKGTYTQHPLTVAQAKEIAKVGLLAMRCTQRLGSSPEEMARIWDTRQLLDLMTELEASKKMMKGHGLIVLLRQMATRLGERQVKESSKSKRKSAGDPNDDESIKKKAKRAKK